MERGAHRAPELLACNCVRSGGELDREAVPGLEAALHCDRGHGLGLHVQQKHRCRAAAEHARQNILRFGSRQREIPCGVVVWQALQHPAARLQQHPR